MSADPTHRTEVVKDVPTPPRWRWGVIRWTRRAALVLVACLLLGISGFHVLNRLYPFPEELLHRARAGGGALLLDRQGQRLAWRVDGGDQWRVPVPIWAIAPSMSEATLAAEDRRFRAHPGVDPLAILRALGQNLWSGRRISGASTLTQQTIRLLDPRPRTWRAKIVEAFRALQLEGMLSKDEILELYLNLAPYGGNVIGVEAAARRYFDKPARELTLGEAALLAGLPQRPSAFHPERHLDRALRRREFVLRRLVALGSITETAAAAARRETIALADPATRRPTPRFADVVLARPAMPIIHATVDTALQRRARAVLDDFRPDLDAMGVTGAALLVVDVPRAEVRAWIGSLHPGDPRHGQIDAATFCRSPGSLLKPFLYARAFERGLLDPATPVLDQPIRFGAYAPVNMDERFMGRLPAAEALRLSRNPPAVALLRRLGVQDFRAHLRSLGLSIPADGRDHGLALALGTPEMRLVDLAAAYRALACGGRYRPLRTTTPFPIDRDASAAPADLGPGHAESHALGIPVMHPGAAYLTLRALGAAAPDAPSRPAWKTGTSFGHRDAWCIAMTPRHVVAVWCGRHDAKGTPDLTGAATALPIALATLEALGPCTVSWPRPPSVRSRRICPCSGHGCGSDCPVGVETESLAGVGFQGICIDCRAQAATLAPGAPDAPSGGTPHIASTDTGSSARPPSSAVTTEETTIEKAANETDRGPILRHPAGDGRYVRTKDARVMTGRAEGNGMLHWYHDEVYLGAHAAKAPVAWPLHAGRHRVTVCDDQGRTATVRYEVVDAARAPAPLLSHRPGPSR